MMIVVGCSSVLFFLFLFVGFVVEIIEGIIVIFIVVEYVHCCSLHFLNGNHKIIMYKK